VEGANDWGKCLTFMSSAYVSDVDDLVIIVM